jgi:hypothetical protein
LFEFVVTSQAAYNHLTEVSCLESTTKHQSLSFSRFKRLTTFVFGVVQIATNIHSAFSSFPDLSLTQVIPRAFQTISSTDSFNTSSIFSFSFNFSTQESSALKVSLL